MSQRLTDVAKAVGVSEATVSRVLNEKPGVSDATRRAVLTALDVLGYERPTKLRGNRAPLVGLFLTELQNPIFPAYGEIVSVELVRNGYTPILCTPSAGKSEEDYIDLLLSHHVSGVIFAGGQYSLESASHGHYARLRSLGLPTVFTNAPTSHLAVPTVSTDDIVAVQQAWRHLEQLGHRKIGLLLGPRDHIPSKRKLAAAEQLSGGSLKSTRVARAQYSIASGQAACAALLQEGVTAIICASDPLALGAIRSARRAGLEIPGDVSIVGFDDSALIPSTSPPLTTVRQPIEPMGLMAVELLSAQMNGTAADPKEYLFEPELIVRASTGVAPS